MPNTKLGLVSVSLFIVFCNDAIFSQEAQDANELIKKVATSYQKLSSYIIEGSLETEVNAQGMHNAMDIPITMAGVVPGKMRMEMKSPMMGFLIVSNGETTWTCFSQLKQYTKKVSAPIKGSTGNTPGGGADIISEYSKLGEKIKDARIVGSDKVEIAGIKRDCYVTQVKGDTLGSSLGVEVVADTLWIEKPTYLILRQVVVTKMAHSPIGVPMDTKVTTKFSTVRINEAVPDTLFAFKPPEEAKEVKEFAIPGMKQNNLVGQMAPDFASKDLNDKEVNLKQYRGKFVLIDFWASWCGPCRNELPTIQKFHKEFRDKGLVVLGVNNEKATVAKEFVKKNDLTFKIFMDDKNTVSDLYGVTALPTVVLIDKDGNVVAQIVGLHSEAELREELKKVGLE